MKRSDWAWIAALLLLMAFIVVRTYGRALDPIIDTGRDLYIPEQIRGGLGLYRDILYYYPPLTPYLLALLTALTGSSLGAYTAIGTAVALLTAGAVYGLCRAAGSPPSAAGMASLLFVTCSVYSLSGRTSNYFFPYAHAAILAMFFFMAGGVCITAWSQRADLNRPWLAAGLLFLLLASWTKLEFAFFSAAVVALAAVVYGLSIRWIGAYVAAGLLSFTAVDRFFAGAPEGHHWLLDNVMASSLLQGSSARYFYRQVSGFDHPGRNAIGALISAAAMVVIVLAIRTTDRWTSRGAAAAVALITALIALSTGDDFFRGWAVLQVVLLPFALRAPREPLLMLLTLSLCGSSRIFLRMTPAWYGFVFLVPTYALIGYVAFQWLPWRGVYSRRAASLAVIPLLAAAGHFLFAAQKVVAQKTYAVPTVRGQFFDRDPGRAAVLADFIPRFRALNPRSLLVVPEGLTLNYLTETRNPISFHTFTPVESAGSEIESAIIRELAARPPQYIVVVSRIVTDFGYRGFGLDYDRRLAAVIQRHYTSLQRWRLPSFELILLQLRARPASGAPREDPSTGPAASSARPFPAPG